ncbi:MAG TPA: queuosine precursor transporter [Acidimicrobiia bacterium]|jgi:hypothetical protein
MQRESLPTRPAVVLALLAAAYVAAQILADVSSLKLANVFDNAIDGGTLIYPITFTLRDLVHKVAGKQVARALIVAAALINVFMAGLFWIVDALPLVPDSGQQSELFGAVLGPVWRIVFASIVAEVISELVDTEVYSAWVRRFGNRSQWGRVLASNAVAVPLDSLVFAVLAFGGLVDPAIVRQIVLTNVVVKLLVTLVSLPLIYTVGSQPEVAPPR